MFCKSIAQLVVTAYWVLGDAVVHEFSLLFNVILRFSFARINLRISKRQFQRVHKILNEHFLNSKENRTGT